MTKRIPRKRHIKSFELSGPIRAVIELETRGNKFHSRTEFLECAVMAYKGGKYPKHLSNFKVLQEEKNGVIP